MKKEMLVAVLCLAMALTACSSRSCHLPSATRIAPPVIPDYPKPEQHTPVATVQTGTGTARDSSFLTSDTPQTVVAFYTTMLMHDGWEVVGSSPVPVDDTDLTFRNGKVCPFYAYFVTIEVRGEKTYVKLRLAESPCACY